MTTKPTTSELLDVFKEMTLIELAGFVKQFEDTFDVKAAASTVVTAVAPTDGAADEVEDEQTDFNVTLVTVGDRKVQVIKEVRSLAKLGIKDAKDLVDGVPQLLLQGVSKANAEGARDTLRAVGATVSIE